ncbi:MAG: hypothetical protein ACREVE_10680 [Gammaproteobacteria bacterium]
MNALNKSFSNVAVKASLCSPTRKHQTAMTLFLTLALIVVQVAGLHFHVHASAPWDALLPAVVHAEHSEAHAACREDTCGTDLSITEFWKNPDQAWNVLALLTVIFALLVLAPRRGIVRVPRTHLPRFNQPVFLRPPLRAPPR